MMNNLYIWQSSRLLAIFVIISKIPLVSVLFLIKLLVFLCIQDLSCIYASSEINIGLAFAWTFRLFISTKNFNSIVLISRQLIFDIINESYYILQTYIVSKLLNTRYIDLSLGLVNSYFKLASSLRLTYPNLSRFLAKTYVLSLFLAMPHLLFLVLVH